MQNIQNKIEIMIKNNELGIKPRWHFILKGILISLSVIFIFILSIFVATFLIFRERMLAPGSMFILGNTIEMLSYLLIALLLFIGGVVIILSHKYDFVYKRPAGVIILVLFIFILAIGFAVDRISFHQRVLESMGDKDFPILRNIYRKEYRNFKMEMRSTGSNMQVQMFQYGNI
jgi:cell division protein FtsL